MKSKELSMLDQSKKMCAEIFCTSTRELFPHSLGIAVEHIIGIFCATVQGLFIMHYSKVKFWPNHFFSDYIMLPTNERSVSYMCVKRILSCKVKHKNTETRVMLER